MLFAVAVAVAVRSNGCPVVFFYFDLVRNIDEFWGHVDTKVDGFRQIWNRIVSDA